MVPVPWDVEDVPVEIGQAPCAGVEVPDESVIASAKKREAEGLGRGRSGRGWRGFLPGRDDLDGRRLPSCPFGLSVMTGFFVFTTGAGSISTTRLSWM